MAIYHQPYMTVWSQLKDNSNTNKWQQIKLREKAQVGPSPGSSKWGGKPWQASLLRKGLGSKAQRVVIPVWSKLWVKGPGMSPGSWPSLSSGQAPGGGGEVQRVASLGWWSNLELWKPSGVQEKDYRGKTYGEETTAQQSQEVSYRWHWENSSLAARC